MRWGRGPAATWSRDATAPASRQPAHGGSRGGFPGAPCHTRHHTPRGVRTDGHERAGRRTSSWRMGTEQLETRRHGLTFLRCSLRVVNGRVIVEMVANYSPYIEPLRCD